MSNPTTYRIAAPYWINGHHNVDGLAIADKMNRNINADDSTDRDTAERELATIGTDDAALHGLTIEESTRADAIMANNADILQAFFTGLASCDYYDGMSHQLYLDLDDDTLLDHLEASDQSWLQRDDGSMVRLLQVSGYADTPEAERYTDDCDLNDYGYSDWLDEVRAHIIDALENA